jgi:hypothetical protein
MIPPFAGAQGAMGLPFANVPGSHRVTGFQAMSPDIRQVCATIQAMIAQRQLQLLQIPNDLNLTSQLNTLQQVDFELFFHI